VTFTFTLINIGTDPPAYSIQTNTPTILIKL